MTIYFSASNIGVFKSSESDKYINNYLIAINTINKDSVSYIKNAAKNGKRFLIDSGVFNLANQYAIENNIDLSEAFKTNPEKFDGYQDLYEKYIKYIRILKEDLWGYIELDIGGQESKIKIREKLENNGLNPIPVYHPYTDNYDYFDYLCQKYNRICVGNFVNADSFSRTKMITDIELRRKNYPKLWIHYLGVTLCPLCYTYTVDSCDSSAFTGVLRWRQLDTTSLLKNSGGVEDRIIKHKGDGYKKALKLSLMNINSYEINYKNYMREINDYQ